MTIATNSVLRRILDDARLDPLPPDRIASVCFTADDQLLQVARTREVQGPPFATSLHFWAHALWAFLDGRGRADAFDALAVNCLCRIGDGPATSDGLAALARRLGDGPGEEAARDLAATDYRNGHLMIEQEPIVSWVAEREVEFVAAFWVRPTWLALARKIVRD